ncbi:MAG TPA: RidA family protein [Acidimicrobiia bacterium]|nr:RidA family protein [Acidimicrobiia bacterium]
MTELISAAAPEPVGPYPHARRAGGFLFLSGMGPRRRGAKEIPGVTFGANGEVLAYDFAAQCRATFANVAAVLEEAGSSLEKVVDVTVFITDLGSDLATLNQIWTETFRSARPTRTTVEVRRLPTPIAIELKVIAEA